MDALENGAKMINRAKVVRVIIENKKAVGVEFRQGKESYNAYAPEIVISAAVSAHPVFCETAASWCRI